MSKFQEITSFLKSKYLWLNVLGICLALIVVVWLVLFWLSSYTRHGQELDLPDFRDISISDAQKLAKEHSFEIFVADSIHIIGKEGGIILGQNPLPGSKVKEHRKVYVTTSKHNPDMVTFYSLPELYGKNYSRKKKELNQGYALQTEIVGRKFDKGPENHILSVIYKGDTIVDRSGRGRDREFPKGGTLQFIVSSKSGGKINVPDLHCLTYAEAKFLIESYNLKIGAAEADASVNDFDGAFIWKQLPAYEEGFKVPLESEIQVYLTAEKPADCP